MADLALHWDQTEGAADLAVEANDLATDDGLETAVMLSLFLDRRAAAGDALPAEGSDRRGWWGDAVPVVEGDAIGSRLWLLDREKQTADVLRRVEEYAREALQWLLDDRVAERLEVTAEVSGRGERLLTVEIFRPRQSDPARFRFGHTWAAMET